MGRGRFSFTFISVLTFGAFLLLQPFASGKEFRRETTCYSDTLHLNCGKLSFIAIHEAYFTTEHRENQTCQSPESEREYIDDEVVTQLTIYSTCYEDIRVTLNRRCSGLKNCTYSYNSLPERNCFNPEGLFVVQYDCVRDSSVNKYCNAKILASEGYITSPGYPQYYPQLNQCSWILSASEGQTISAKILHLHLRDATEVTPTVSDPDAIYALGIRGVLTSEQVRRCDDDRLTVVEGIVKRFAVCGEDLQSLRSVEVDASADLELRFRSVAFLPAPGFLVYFKILGCPSPSASEGSYLVERNGSAAVFACHNNQVFNDTLEGKRFLQCVRDHHWNDTLPPCTTYEELITTTIMAPNSSIEEMINHIVVENETTTEGPLFDKKAGLIEDIIVPCILIGILIIGNAIIVMIIFIIRKRQSKNIEDEIEEEVEPKTQPLVAAEETDDV